MTTSRYMQTLVEHVRYVYIAPRFSGQTLYLVVFPIPGASLLGAERQKKHKKVTTLSIKPQSHLSYNIDISNVACYFSD